MEGNAAQNLDLPEEGVDVFYFKHKKYSPQRHRIVNKCHKCLKCA
jgi:hypothetical protein